MKKRKSFFSFLKSRGKFEKNIKSIIGFYPNDAFYYELAFIHKSLVNNEKGKYTESNERLEFLGDAILSSIVSERLFKKYPTMNEGALSTLRSKIVSRSTLNVIGKKLELDKCIKANVNQAAMENSVLGNTLEALIGAIYIDKGFKHTKSFILKKIIDEHIKLSELNKLEVNYKSKILEWGQKNKKEIIFKLIEEGGSGHKKTFTIALYIEEVKVTEATASSKKKAEQKAAKFYTELIKKNDNG